MRYHVYVDREELRRRMARHPRTVSFAEARAVLEAYGWQLDRVRGSHHIFRHPESGGSLNVPLRRPSILPAYVRKVLSVTEGDDRE
jgi:predicted RNA binding protein YcfA (HicA-like mRNA interferase family)